MIWKILRGRAVLIRPASGLGNQLFLYFAGLFVAHNSDRELFIDVSRLKAPQVSHGGNINSYKLSGSFVSLSLSGRILNYVLPRISRFRRFANWLGIYVAPDLGHQRDLVSKLDKLRYVEGFFMCDEYITSLVKKGVIKELALKNPSDSYKSLFQDFSKDPILLVHVRRGDFLAHPDHWGILSEYYYLKAIQLIKEKSKKNFKIVVISDNIKLVEEEFQDLEWHDSIFLDTSNYDPAEVLNLFTFADAVVIGNSTFSWWGSFFSKASIVVAPSPFYRASPEFSDLNRDNLTFIESAWN